MPLKIARKKKTNKQTKNKQKTSCILAKLRMREPGNSIVFVIEANATDALHERKTAGNNYIARQMQCARSTFLKLMLCTQKIE